MLEKDTMKAFGKRMAILVVLTALVGAGWAKSPPEATQFEEIYQVIRANLTGLDLEQFEKEVIRGLLRRTDGSAELVRKKNPSVELTEASRIFDDSYGYLRIRNVEAGLAEAIRVGFAELEPKGDLTGLMLDLRFAEGRDYSAAVMAANQFVNDDRTQLVVGEQHLRTVQSSNIITGPITVLVNRETSGAAEALAAVLRRNEVGLIIGSTTAAKTKVFSEFELNSGSKLRVATGEVRFDDGKAVSENGLEPDIAVQVKLDDERFFFTDAYATPEGRKSKRRLNEAQLVRALKLRLNPDSKLEKAADIPSEREVFDPVLARALDLLKGLNTIGAGH
jgi:hypothetical protein